MIKILVLDDNNEKVHKILDLISSIPEIRTESIAIANDLIQARDLCRQYLYDLLILDLRLPNRFGDEPQDLAGCDFIKELNTSRTLIKPFHIIGITAYDENLIRADPIFEEDLWRVIKYDPSNNAWRKQLHSKLQWLVTSQKALIISNSTNHEYDLGIVTAVHSPELRSILDLPGNWIEIKQPNDTTIYHKGHFESGEKKISVVAACAQQMGMPAASVLTMKIINHFRPRYLAICGIAAAVRDRNINLGDILVADQSWDYESGKHIVEGDKQFFVPDPKCIPLDVQIKEWIQHLSIQRKFLDGIKKDWRGAIGDKQLEIHIGPFASGAGVVQDEKIIQHIKSHARKLIGIDMETYGVFYAAENCPMPRPKVISIKSACDFADIEKTDDLQHYAAYTSAQYLFRFALDKL